MNIKITYNWLCEYLETDADAYELQKFLSLCGPGFERVDEVQDPFSPSGKDYVFDIEVTSNRVDMASVFGIAQEATSILPQFGKKAKLKLNPLEQYTFENLNAEPNNHKKLNVTIANPDICPRFTAVIFSDVQVKPAPEVIRQRLQWCDVKSINNIVDISNYLMLSLGQPTHMFDYDKIAKHTMIVRESKKGEKLITLDEKEITLPGGDIVIEDGEGRLIDLCGIMGGANSEITNDTTSVVFFVQTYDKRKIRKTSMLTGQRTVAATYFEKGLDTERVENTLVYGVDLLNQFSGGIVDSQIIDIYHHPYKEKKVTTYLSDVHRIMGIQLEAQHVASILTNLGFKVETHIDQNDVKFNVSIPSFRKDDVEIKEDIIEEVARVYGYHNLPNNIAPMAHIRQPKEIEKLFTVQNKIKTFLKHIGLHEVMNYSMISKELIQKLDLPEQEFLKLANTISEEIQYMRISLIPSLIKNIKDNQGKRTELKFFELAKIYLKRKGELPKEEYQLSFATNTSFFDLKGMIEAMLSELHIHNLEIRPSSIPYLLPNVQAQLSIDGEYLGVIGQLKTQYKDAMGLKDDTILAELNFATLLNHYKLLNPYKNPSPYATIWYDVTIKQNPNLSFAKIKSISLTASQILKDIGVINTFKENITLRFIFSADDRNITEEEVKKELEKIQKYISSYVTLSS